MKTLKHPRFLIPIIIIIIMLGWIGYQKINEIKIQQAEKQTAEQQDIDVDDTDIVGENITDKFLDGDNPTQKTEADDKASVTNPASVYCQDQGHKLEIRAKEDGSQYGMCIFDDGSECEEWAYFRGKCSKGNSLREIAKDLMSDVKEETNADWNSFTHRAYNYTIKFPKDWHWDGTNADILIISSESIKSNDENLTANNLKIIKANQEIIEKIFEKSADAIIVGLDANFKAVYLRNNQFKNIIEQIIKSFEI